MKILIIHHLEEIWKSGYEMYGTSFEEQASNIIAHLEENDYDRVILSRFEEWELGEEHHCSGIAEYIDTVHIYAYGWDMTMVEQDCFPEDQRWTEGGSHSEIVLIDKWMENLINDDVSLCGAFDGECIEDMELALSGTGVDVKRIEDLII